MREWTTLFRSGELGHHTYRIPALVETPNGGVLALCEARRDSASDTGQIDIVCRHSDDGGKRWSDLRTVVSRPGMCCGNPAPVLDRSTGTLVMLFCMNRACESESQILVGAAVRQVWVTRSSDGGQSWSDPEEITQSVKPAGWGWYATGPGHGIQTSGGRLVVACDHSLMVKGGPRYRSHLVYSDDGGLTWQLGGVVKLLGTNESTVTETAPGKLYLNCRYHSRKRRRVGAWSSDEGLTFDEARVHDGQIDPICQGATLKLLGEAGLALTHVAHKRRRRGLVLRRSTDQGRTWRQAEVLSEGPSAYSDLVQTTAGALLCLAERGRKSPYETLALTVVPLSQS